MDKLILTIHLSMFIGEKERIVNNKIKYTYYSGYSKIGYMYRLEYRNKDTHLVNFISVENELNDQDINDANRIAEFLLLKYG